MICEHFPIPFPVTEQFGIVYALLKKATNTSALEQIEIESLHIWHL